jgi:hypothetical protein
MSTSFFFFFFFVGEEVKSEVAYYQASEDRFGNSFPPMSKLKIWAPICHEVDL